MTSLEKRAFELLGEALQLMQDCMPDEVTNPDHIAKYEKVKQKVDEAADIIRIG